MKKTPELIWELSIALIAFAGGLTLISSFFPEVPGYIFGGFFALAFLFMFASFIWRIYESQHPVELLEMRFVVDTSNRPKFHIMMGISARDKVNINSIVLLKLDKKVFTQLREIADFNKFCKLQIANNGEIFTLNTGDFISVTGDIQIRLYENRDKQDLENISFENKVKLGWRFIGKGTLWNKPVVDYLWQLPELDVRYPTMIRKRGERK